MAVHDNSQRFFTSPEVLDGAAPWRLLVHWPSPGSATTDGPGHHCAGLQLGFSCTADFNSAEDETTRIFREAGVAVLWFNCPLSISEAEANPMCIEPCPTTRFAVRINSDMPPGLAKTSLGVALSESGIYATIYYPRVDEYAKQGIATHSQILGHAIAHEMGHLFLGPVPHTRFGIMRGGWAAGDLQSMAIGAFLFSSHQSALIRQAAMRRTGSQKGAPLE